MAAEVYEGMGRRTGTQVGLVESSGEVFSGMGRLTGTQVGFVATNGEVFRGIGRATGKQVGFGGSDGAIFTGLGRHTGKQVGFVDRDGEVFSGIGRYTGKQVGFVEPRVARTIMAGAAYLLVLDPSERGVAPPRDTRLSSFRPSTDHPRSTGSRVPPKLDTDSVQQRGRHQADAQAARRHQEDAQAARRQRPAAAAVLLFSAAVAVATLVEKGRISAVAVSLALFGLATGTLVNFSVEWAPHRKGHSARQDGVPLGGGNGASRLMRQASTGFLLFATGMHFGLTSALPAYLVFFVCLLIMSIISIERGIVPNVMTYPSIIASVLLLSLAAAADGTWSLFRGALIGAMAAWGAMLLIHIAVPSHLGFGNVRQSLLIGLFLGWLGLSEVLIGVGLGLVLGVFGIALPMLFRVGRVNFSPFLAIGATIVVLFGHEPGVG